MRRLVDLVFASAVLILASPLLLAIALMVVLSSPGPAFYPGWRAGRDGKQFRMWKFRTMVAGADKLGPPITGRSDPRITGIGRFLRRTKLDELPQFVNVLLGDMTLVGPRPEAPDIVALYTPSQRAVLTAKPGVTGRVQLDAGEESEAIPQGAPPDEYYVQHLMDRKLRSDLEYLRIRTPFSDLRILLETAGLVFRALVQR
jgi:lipopolysaccharide/colanic/teichoic acid biosynthesis glycosyltransferase